MEEELMSVKEFITRTLANIDEAIQEVEFELCIAPDETGKKVVVVPAHTDATSINKIKFYIKRKEPEK